MSIAPVSSNALAADAKSLNALKLQAGQATPASIKEAAKRRDTVGEIAVGQQRVGGTVERQCQNLDRLLICGDRAVGTGPHIGAAL